MSGTSNAPSPRATAGTECPVHTQTVDDHGTPTIARLASGCLVVIWTDPSGARGDDSGTTTKAQFFDAAGGKLGAEFLIDTETVG